MGTRGDRSQGRAACTAAALALTLACGSKSSTSVESTRAAPTVAQTADAGADAPTVIDSSIPRSRDDGVSGSAVTWTVQVADHAANVPLARVSVTLVELTWDCKTRELDQPRQDPDDRYRQPRIETYDCKGGKQELTQLTDAVGTATFHLPHAQFLLRPIKHASYFPTDFRDPVYQRIAGSLMKMTITSGNRHISYSLFPYAGLKVKTEAEARQHAMNNAIVQNCLAMHPQLTHAVKKPSLLWRVQFADPGAKNMRLEATVDSISSDVGILGCWDPCCANRRPSH
jgi:hypothetical protein